MARSWTRIAIAAALLLGVQLGAASARASVSSVAPMPAAQPPVPEDLDEGARLWRAGDREGAEAAWRAALDALAAEDPEVHLAAERARLAYNLGNAAYRDGRFLEAVGWYTASLRLEPRDPDARANLDLARAEAGLPPVDAGDLSGALLRSMRSVEEGEARWLALLGVALAGLGLLYEALRGGAAGRLAAGLGLAALVLLWMPFVAQALGGDHDHLVVAADGLPARSEPRQDAKRITTLDPGVEVTVTDRYLDWARVRTDGGELWVPASGLFPLDR